MKIENRPGAVPERLEPRREDSTTRRVENRPARPGEDQVALSPLARTLPRLVQEVGDPRTVDATRVAGLRADIDAGRYDPANEAVARSLLRGIVEEET